MEKINFNYFCDNFDFYVKEALNNKIFIYPTDTIYWIWSIVNKSNIERIYDIKKRDKNKPFSIVAPNIDWIKENFITSNDFEEKFNFFLENNHGITVILSKKNNLFLPDIWVNNKVWVRILKNNFQNFVTKLNQAFITTSANISNTDYIEDEKYFEEKFEKNVDYILIHNYKKSVESRIIDFTDNYKILR